MRPKTKKKATKKKATKKKATKKKAAKLGGHAHRCFTLEVGLSDICECEAYTKIAANELVELAGDVTDAVWDHLESEDSTQNVVDTLELLEHELHGLRFVLKALGVPVADSLGKQVDMTDPITINPRYLVLSEMLARYPLEVVDEGEGSSAAH